MLGLQLNRHTTSQGLLRGEFEGAAHRAMIGDYGALVGALKIKSDCPGIPLQIDSVYPWGDKNVIDEVEKLERRKIIL